MSNRANSTRPPSYRLHKASGQAVVTIDRKDRYLGVHGTPESRLRYERLISAWMRGEPVPAREPESSNDITVAEVCVQYLRWAEGSDLLIRGPGGLRGVRAICLQKRGLRDPCLNGLDSVVGNGNDTFLDWQNHLALTRRKVPFPKHYYR